MHVKLIYCLVQCCQGWVVKLNLLFGLHDNWMWTFVVLSKEGCSPGVQDIVALISSNRSGCILLCYFANHHAYCRVVKREGVFWACVCHVSNKFVYAMDQRVAKLLLLNYIGPGWVKQVIKLSWWFKWLCYWGVSNYPGRGAWEFAGCQQNGLLTFT
jgi:hypothetical protein